VDCGNVRVALREDSQDVWGEMAQFGGGGAVLSHQDKAAVSQRRDRDRGREIGRKHRSQLMLQGAKPPNLPCEALNLGQAVEQRSDSKRGHCLAKNREEGSRWILS
jgi:hypothetical protein